MKIAENILKENKISRLCLFLGDGSPAEASWEPVRPSTFGLSSELPVPYELSQSSHFGVTNLCVGNRILCVCHSGLQNRVSKLVFFPTVYYWKILIYCVS